MKLQDQLTIRLQFCPFCGAKLDSDMNTWELTERDLALLKSLGEPISKTRVKELLGKPAIIDDIFGDGSVIHSRYDSLLESGVLILIDRGGPELDPIVIQRC